MNYKFADIPMKNYLVASSSPLTESVERLLCCKKAHFSAAILKSCADYDRTGNGHGRKVVYVDDGYYADASFENEIMTLSEGLSLYKEASEAIGNDMLLIPSISVDSLELDEWISICEKFQSLGASILQLDFFYLGTLAHNASFYASLEKLLSGLVTALSARIMPKLNLRFDPDVTFPILKKSGVKIVSLLDSMREDPDAKYNLHKGTTSYFGPRQFPHTLRYLKAAKACGLMVCAGGGIAKKEDLLMLLSQGADMIQTASYILNRDYSHTKDLLPDNKLYTFEDILLKHNPWCDYPDRRNCDHCGACKKHRLP